MNQHTIELSISNGQWISIHSDPLVRSLFGTCAIPTPYNSDYPADKVLASIVKANPDRIVTINQKHIP